MMCCLLYGTFCPVSGLLKAAYVMQGSSSQHDSFFGHVAPLCQNGMGIVIGTRKFKHTAALYC